MTTKPASSAGKTACRLRTWCPVLAGVVLVGAVWLIYARTLGYDFLDYDEQHQIVVNPLVRGLAPGNLARIFTSRSETSYYPFRLLSFALDHAFWGMDPTGFHLTNVVLHSANVVLVLWLALRLIAGRRPILGPAGGASCEPAASAARNEVPGRSPRRPSSIPANPGGANSGSRLEDVWLTIAAATAAGLFALHPVVVEPVAWVGGREELLMVLGALGCLHFYVSARRLQLGPGGTTGRIVGLHAAAVAACAFACGSNAVGAVVPLMATAYDAVTLPGGKRRRLLDAAGLWLVGAATVVLKLTEPVSPGAQATRLALPLAGRPLLVLNLYPLNLRTLLWPQDLTIRYPWRLPEGVLSPWALIGMAAVVGTVVALYLLRRRRVMVLGLVWFLLALAPSSQIVPHHVNRADRFLYLPVVGVAVLVAGAVARLNRTSWRAAFVAAAVPVLGLLGVLSWRQVPVWKDSVTLFGRAVRLNPRSALGHRNLGFALAERGKLREAIHHYRQALALKPRYFEAYNNMGTVLFQLGLVEEAIDHYRKALDIDPRHVGALSNLGTAYAKLGRYEEAVAAYRAARAAAERTGPEVDPRLAEVHYNLANTLARTGQLGPAIGHYEEALRIEPERRDALWNLAVVLTRAGRHVEAVRRFEELLALERGHVGAMNALARLLATSPLRRVRDPGRGVALAERACRATDFADPESLFTLALAHESAGWPAAAARAAERALTLAEAAGQDELAARIRERLAADRERQQGNEPPAP